MVMDDTDDCNKVANIINWYAKVSIYPARMNDKRPFFSLQIYTRKVHDMKKYKANKHHIIDKFDEKCIH